MKIAIASPSYPMSLDDGLQQADYWIQAAARQGALIIGFSESYIPGYPGPEFQPEKCSPEKLQWALDEVCKMAAAHKITVVMPMDWHESGRLLNVVFVISDTGTCLGYQTKNQLDPSEDNIWEPGSDRQLFEVAGLKFGITICHEGFRYPESVRWAAMNGAQLVFHPNCTGSNLHGEHLEQWGHTNNPYYEKAQLMRAHENAIYIAGINYAFDYPDSASSVIDPEGNCICYQPYREPGILIADIEPEKATRLYAKRFRSALYIDTKLSRNH